MKVALKLYFWMIVVLMLYMVLLISLHHIVTEPVAPSFVYRCNKAGASGTWVPYPSSTSVIANRRVREYSCHVDDKFGNWNQEAYEDLKQRQTSAPILVYQFLEGEFVLDTNANNVGIRGVLSQMHGGHFDSYGLLIKLNNCFFRKSMLDLLRRAIC